MNELKASFRPEDILDSFNGLNFIINKSIINSVNTMLLVKVLQVYENELDVIPLLKNLSNEKTPIDQSPIYSVKFLQFQYGTNAIIAKPVVGDIGILITSKQDISGAIKDGESICQTSRHFNLCDSVYIGGVIGLNNQPTQFLELKGNELNIKGTGTINISAPTVNIKDATAIKLGTNATKKIALDGDPVKSGNTVVGNIVASSTIVKAL